MENDRVIGDLKLSIAQINLSKLLKFKGNNSFSSSQFKFFYKKIMVVTLKMIR